VLSIAGRLGRRSFDSSPRATLGDAMTLSKVRKIFVNLPVANIQRSNAFFKTLGFRFNPQFSGEDTTCMVLSEDGYVMLLQTERFKSFVKKPLSDASQQTEAIFALSADSRAEVDELTDLALASGGSPALPPQDHGFMYGRSFCDPDGHHWEVFYMDPAALQSPEPSPAAT
jgi:predicted lactoylglutathione lyase